MPKAEVACAILAKDSAKTIGTCLDSVVPYVKQVVVCVDELTTDDTAQIASSHGAEVHSIKVSDWHECEYHGRVLAQDFARARNESFGYLTKDAKWWLWIDSDDVIEGADKMTEVLAAAPEGTEGIWLPYHYATVQNRKATTTLFDRERFLRTDLDWEWVHPVHEVCRLRDRPPEHTAYSRTDLLRIYHQEYGHNTAGAAKRNILVLEIVLEQNHNDQWALFYLGNQYFALGRWAESIQAYSRALNNDNAYQLWQTYLYLSMAYEKLGDLGNAKAMAFHASDVRPMHPEPYYRLAACYLLEGDVEKVEFWTRMGDKLPEPPFFVFKNPMDRSFNARVTLAQAYGNVGQVSQARAELEKAKKVCDNPEVDKALAYYTTMERNAGQAEALATTLRLFEPAERIDLWKSLNLSKDLLVFGRIRDEVMPHIIKGRVSTQPRVLFYCGRSVEPWAPPSINAGGIGGSETGVIQIANQFSQDGWQVDVYNDCDFYEGEYDDVGYWDCKRIENGQKADLLVSWRQAQVPSGIDAKARVLWCHDLHLGPDGIAAILAFDRVLGVSQWHADYLRNMYSVRSRPIDHITFAPNGIDLARFDTPLVKVPFRCVYASSPDRGLDRLLKAWPAILEMEPAAELHIAYGWQTIDRYIQMGASHLVDTKNGISKLIEATPRVVWRDRLGQADLARLYCESYLWLYPTTFTEVSCISAMEAMAGGAVPVTSKVGALAETIGEAGLVVGGWAYGADWLQFWTSVARGALMDRTLRTGYQAKGFERVQQFTWAKSYEKWRQVIDGIFSGKKELVCA